jgi:hypothetical protein
MSLSEKPSRLNQRSLGVTNRVWAIILLFLFIIGFTRWILPTQNEPQPRFNHSIGLKAKNYLNKTQIEIEPNPFNFCPVFGPGDEIGKKYGALTLSQSRLHLGSGGRIQRVIHKALLGQPVTMSVLGGSVSACHGAGDDPISHSCYPSRFFEWWNTVFPHPASELTNGAMRRTNSAYFGFCNAHHLPDYTDLVILEFDVDDSPDRLTMENFELLVRSILLREDQPAVLILGHFSPQVHQQSGFGGPEIWHNIVAQFYDVPHVSIRPALYPQYIKDPGSITKYFTDAVLANSWGHEIITDILISYFQSQICSAWDIAVGKSYESVPLVSPGDGETHGLFGGVGQRKAPPTPDQDKDPFAELLEDPDSKKAAAAAAAAVAPAVAPHPVYPQLGVPNSLINSRPNSARPFEEVRPFCVSANDLVNPLPPSLFYGSGWFSFHPQTTSTSSHQLHYWYSILPTSKVRIPISVGAGDVGVYYLKEPIGYGEGGEGSAVECWVDDNYGGAKVIENGGDVSSGTPALEIIDHYVAQGPHFVECMLLGEEGQSVPSFKILGIFAT